MEPNKDQIPHGYKEVPANPQLISYLRYFESPDGLTQILFGTLTGTMLIWRRRNLLAPFRYHGMIAPGERKIRRSNKNTLRSAPQVV